MNELSSNRPTVENRALVYRSLEPSLKRTLVALSRLGWIYIGRYGYGFTKRLRRESGSKGTLPLLDRLRKEYGSRPDSGLAGSLISSLVIEGSIFCSYSRAKEDYYEPENAIVSDTQILKPEGS